MASMDRTAVFFDLNYFKYCFLKTTGLDFNEVKLEKAFSEMAKDLVGDPDKHAFQYRDFQARNVMLDRDGSPCFIDFQGGRRGPVEYDVASFLWQAFGTLCPGAAPRADGDVPRCGTAVHGRGRRTVP